MNEPRYINANGLKDTLDYYISEAGWTAAHNEALTWVKDEFIDAEPTADVAPVVHGHWSKEMRFTEDFMGNRTYGYKCSVCGKLANRLQFCGNCGAKMDESEV